MRQRTHGLSPAQQALDLRRRFGTDGVSLSAAELVWTGTIEPTALSRAYNIRVRYRRDRPPRVLVLDVLETYLGRSLPHVYADGTLCLHKGGEWAPSMFISESTLVWTAEWLFNYEIWRATGDWHGGGEWPPSRPIDN